MNIKKICNRCIYDENVADISFDSEGICNYCRRMEQMEEEYPVGDEGDRILKNIVQQIKISGKNSKYDCVVGVSGGTDSSFLLYKMKEMGLRPLAAFFDNTWNSTIATENIKKVTSKLKVDLFTIVVNNKEYDDIYRSFLKAGVPDIEAPTDIGFAATHFRAAEKFKIKYVIEGHSFRTEGISPLGMLYMDGKYIKTIQKQFGTYRTETYPNMSLLNMLKWMVVKRIKKIRPLYYIDYQKEKVKEFLADEFGWQWYHGHHLENRFTAFYHSYFLPKRFGIDTRSNGFAALVRSGQMDRNEGLRLMDEPPYLENELIDLVKKRIGFSDKEFEDIMNLPKKNYTDYKTYKRTFERMRLFFWLMYKMDLIPKSFYLKYTVKHEI
jgi:N-acetyl sugar amidotransferase